MLDLQAPTESPPLRDYQQACVDAVLNSEDQAIYYTLPTGTGKTRYEQAPPPITAASSWLTSASCTSRPRPPVSLP